eukprot:Pgem_evm1s17682
MGKHFCGYCAGQIICTDQTKDCKICYNKPFATFKDKRKVEAWNTEKNGNLLP